MPILPLYYPMPMTAVGNIMLRPFKNADGNVSGLGHAADVLRSSIKEDLNDGWVLQDQKLIASMTEQRDLNDNEKKYWQDGLSMGLMYCLLIALTQKHPEYASWESAKKLVGHIRSDQYLKANFPDERRIVLPHSADYLDKVKNQLSFCCPFVGSQHATEPVCTG